MLGDAPRPPAHLSAAVETRQRPTGHFADLTHALWSRHYILTAASALDVSQHQTARSRRDTAPLVAPEAELPTHQAPLIL